MQTKNDHLTFFFFQILTYRNLQQDCGQNLTLKSLAAMVVEVNIKF